ncbi:hypothetical protein PAMP_010308 [Pampus punctatissimus]
MFPTKSEAAKVQYSCTNWMLKCVTKTTLSVPGNNLEDTSGEIQYIVFTLKGDSSSAFRSGRLDCVKASEHCLKEYSCSTKYRTMRQCVAGRESNFSAVTGTEAQGECRSAIEAMKQSPLYDCRCRRGMKKEKNCLRIFWSIFQSLQGNDLLEYSPYEPVNSRLSDIFRLAPIIAGLWIEIERFTFSVEPASTKENNCLNAAKACNLNDTCKKYRSAYINPCTSRVSASEVCNKRKCHKALRQFFDKRGIRQHVQNAEDKPLYQSAPTRIKTNLTACRFRTHARPTISAGTVMTPNYVRSLGISLSPWCDCSSSGNSKTDCDKFAEFFTNNRCLRNAIQAFGNGTDVGVWQPQPPIQPTVLEPSITQRGKERTNNALDALTDMTKMDLDTDSLYHICGTLQAQKLMSNVTLDTAQCVNHQLDESSDSNAIARSSPAELTCLHPSSMLLALAFAFTPTVLPLEGI